MISRLLLSVVIAMLFNASQAHGCETYKLTDKQRQYFEGLSLPLNVPQGKSTSAISNRSTLCSLRDDFNKDGVTDFAGLFEYTGERTRSGGWDLDLVILYSDAGQTKHIIFPYAGQTENNGAKLREYLAMQYPGRVDLKPGKMMLDYPAIISYRDDKPAVIYYWNEKQFSTASYYVDD